MPGEEAQDGLQSYNINTESQEMVAGVSPLIIPVSPTFFFYISRGGCILVAKIRREDEECIYYICGSVGNNGMSTAGRKGGCTYDGLRDDEGFEARHYFGTIISSTN